MKNRKIWKLAVNSRLELDQIEAAAAEVPELTKETAPIRGVELQRIDFVKGRSFVFVTGSGESTRALKRCLKARVDRPAALAERGVTVRLTRATKKELHANEPPQN